MGPESVEVDDDAIEKSNEKKREAVGHFSEGNYDEAAKAYTEAILLNPRMLNSVQVISSILVPYRFSDSVRQARTSVFDAKQTKELHSWLRSGNQAESWLCSGLQIPRACLSPVGWFPKSRWWFAVCLQAGFRRASGRMAKISHSECK